jgi:hypothetical protein
MFLHLELLCFAGIKDELTNIACILTTTVRRADPATSPAEQRCSDIYATICRRWQKCTTQHIQGELTFNFANLEYQEAKGKDKMQTDECYQM